MDYDSRFEHQQGNNYKNDSCDGNRLNREYLGDIQQYNRYPFGGGNSGYRGNFSQNLAADALHHILDGFSIGGSGHGSQIHRPHSPWNQPNYPGQFNPGHHNPGQFNPGHYNPGHPNPGHYNPGHHSPGHNKHRR